MSDASRTVERVVAVVVTFHPDLDRLSALLATTLPQVDHVYIVDNGDGAVLQAVLSGIHRATLIVLGENRGIGAAQNAGTLAAIDGGADFVLLLDQDSVPAAGLVRGLLAARSFALTSGLRVAAVGPTIVGPNGSEGFVRVGLGTFRSVLPAAHESWVECDQLIASGCLICLASLRVVGLMDESLFIDKVDTEWCLRAKAKGYSLLGARDAHLSHRLGKQRARFWFLRWRSVPIHDASRYYYMFRNAIRVHRMPHATLPWRVADWNYTLKLLVGIGLTGLAGRVCLLAMISGLYDGLRGIDGPKRCG